MNHDYSYCFLRYRQDPEADEFANVGLALYSPASRFLAFQGSRRYGRLTHFFGDLDRDGYRLLLAHVERRFETLAARLAEDLPLDPAPPSVRELARQVVPEDDGALIWSPARGGLTQDPRAELGRLFGRFVAFHNAADDQPRRDEDQVFRDSYRKAFTDPLVVARLEPHEVVAPLIRHLFKYAWKSGVWHVYETLSFDLVDPDSLERKAHTWCSRSLHLAKSPDQPRIYFLLGNPSLPSASEAFACAKAILSSCPNVTLVEEHQADHFAQNLLSLVSRS